MSAPRPDEVPLEISPSEAAAILAAPTEPCLLLDCRTPEEHATARIEGAMLLPMQEIAARVGELEAWRGRTIVVHCHHGVRSLRVTQWLRERGFASATSLRGGIDAWSAEVDPTVPVY
ncbi:MAG: putative adenylyltransferase/sulfurtransferase MoeZ [Planctomycetota bacterium]|jgi:rhodanese-related sulfurtransferase